MTTRKEVIEFLRENVIRHEMTGCLEITYLATLPILLSVIEFLEKLEADEKIAYHDGAYYWVLQDWWGGCWKVGQAMFAETDNSWNFLVIGASQPLPLNDFLEIGAEIKHE